jgi:ubiquinone/menaquinone biosynthesis C-methylase UbiE
MDNQTIRRYWEQESTVQQWNREFAALDLGRRQAWLDVLRRNLGVGRKRQNILDVATGTGLLALLSAELRHKVIGVDRSAAMLRQAETNRSAHHKSADFVLGDAFALEFSAATFDAVLGRYALSSMGNPISALHEWRRVLKPGGRLILIEDDPADAKTKLPLGRLARWNYGFSPVYGKLYQELLAQSGQDKAPPLELEGLVSRAGLNIVFTGKLAGQLQQSAKWMHLTYHFPHLIVVAEKPT